MPNRQYKDELSGPFIYRDNKNRVIYSNPLLKNDYLVNNSEARTFGLFSMRFPIAVLAGLIISLFNKNYLLAVIAALLILLVSTLYFWFIYIPKLPVIEKYTKVPKESFLDRLAKSSKKRLFLLIFLVVSLAFLVVYNAIASGYTGFTLYANFAIAVGCGVYLGILLIALMKNQ